MQTETNASKPTLTPTPTPARILRRPESQHDFEPPAELMKRYQVSYETKRCGNIGNGEAWGVNSKTVEGATEEQAAAEAMLQLHADGWQVRNVVNVLEIIPKFYDSNPLSTPAGAK